MQLINHEDVTSFFESLDVEQRRVVSCWREKRVRLLQNLRNRTVERIYQDENLPVRESKPLLKLKVKTPARNDLEAIITFWGVTDEQIGFLQEGRCIRLRHVNVKDKLQNHILQLSTSIKTRVMPLPIKPKKKLALAGYLDRSFPSFSKVHLISRKCNSSSDVDIIGCVLKSVIVDNNAAKKIAKIYFVDESGLVIRLQRNLCDDKTFSQWKLLKKSGMIDVFAVYDVAVMPFDFVEGCAVVQWSNQSALTSNDRQRETDLKTWANTNKTVFKQLSDTVGTLLCPASLIPSNLLLIFGYVKEIMTLKFIDDVPFVSLHIDCGDTTREAICTLDLFQNILALLEIDDTALSDISFQQPSLDWNDEKLRMVFTQVSRKIKKESLLQFTLQKLSSKENQGLLSISDARRAPIRMLCSLLITRALQGKKSRK